MFTVGSEFQKRAKDTDTLLQAVSANLGEYLHPFEHCTTMAYTEEKFSWRPISKINWGPIILFLYETGLRSVNGKIIFRKFSVQLRRNLTPHCWATFTILPENAGLLDRKNKHHLISMLSPRFLDALIWSQYFILVTSTPDVVREYFVYYPVSNYPSLREVIIVDTFNFVETFPFLRMSYQNIYHVKGSTQLAQHSEEWYTVECLPSDCFTNLFLLGKNISKQNKYFWQIPYPLGLEEDSIIDLLNQTDYPKSRHSHDWYRQLANLTSVNGFLGFWVLQDLLY